MKLTLSDQEGVCVLTGTGEISEHDIQVLRAGLTKLFKSGKNRIVVDIPDADKLPPEMLRELSALDMLARELSGRIVLAGINPGLRDQIAKFAKPPIIECLETRELAVKKLAAKPEATLGSGPATEPADGEAAPAAAPAPAKTGPTLSPAQQAAAAVEEAKKEKAELRKKELGEASDLRKEVEKLKNEVQLLTQQLHAAILGRRAPANEAAQKGQVEVLEQELAALIKETQAADAGGAAPKAKA